MSRTSAGKPMHTHGPDTIKPWRGNTHKSTTPQRPQATLDSFLLSSTLLVFLSLSVVCRPTDRARTAGMPPSEPFASTKDASGQQPLWLPHRIHALCNAVDRVVVSTSRQVVKHIHGLCANIAQTLFHAALWWYLPVWPSPGNSSPCDGATATSARFVSGTRGQWECFRIRAVILFV